MPSYTSPTSYLGLDKETPRFAPEVKLTPTELAAPAGMSTQQGGYMTGANNIPTPAQSGTPTLTQAPQQTIGDQLSSITQQPGGIQAGIDRPKTEEQAAAGGSGFNVSTYDDGPEYDDGQLTEKEIRNIQRRQLQLHQGEIDAQNRIYDQQLAEARLEGEGRLGSFRAQAGRRGMVGGDFAAAHKGRIQDFNTQEQQAVEAQRMAAIGSIMSGVRNAVESERAAKQEAKTLGAENWRQFQKDKGVRRQQYAQQIAQEAVTQGFDLNTMTPEELKGIIDPESGITTQDLLAAYASAKSGAEAAGAEADLDTREREAGIAEIEAKIEQGKVKSVGEGTMLYNMETGETFKNPKTYKPDAPSGLTIGVGTLPQEAVADIHLTLNESRDESRYADTDVYMQEFNDFVASQGDPKDFIKEYDPNIYIDPEDEARSFLKSQMKKTTAQTLSEIDELIELTNRSAELKSAQGTGT